MLGDQPRLVLFPAPPALLRHSPIVDECRYYLQLQAQAVSLPLLIRSQTGSWPARLKVQSRIQYRGREGCSEDARSDSEYLEQHTVVQRLVSLVSRRDGPSSSSHAYDPVAWPKPDRPISEPFHILEDPVVE